MKAGFREASLPPKEARMLEFVGALTLEPWAAGASERRRLREAGWNDHEVLHVVLGCAMFNYFNRMADGLGIPLEYVTDLPQAAVPGEEGRALEKPGFAAAATAGDGRGADPEDLFRAMAGNREAAEVAREWRAFQFRGTPDLPEALRIRMALLTARLTRWPWGIALYGERLAALGARELPAEALPPRERTILLHAARLTDVPWTVGEGHVAELRREGLDDVGIVRLTILASYMSFERRAFQGLGVGASDEG